MQALTDFDLASLPFYAHTTTTFAGLDNIIVATTGYTGSGGVEIYCKNNEVAQLWKAIFKAGEVFGVQPIGLAERHPAFRDGTVYMEMKDDYSSPIAAGLGWVTRPYNCFYQRKKDRRTKRKRHKR